MAPIGRSRAGFILAGGKSSRMGEDKAFIDLGGQTLLDRALAAMGMACDSITIVGDTAKFAKYESAQLNSTKHDSAKNDSIKHDSTKYRPSIADIFPVCGPLGGIHTALVHSSAELNLILAVDMPFVSGELLRFLWATAENNNNDNDALVTVPRVGERLQPLCALYRREFSSLAEEALRVGKYKIDAVFAGVPIRVIEESELRAAGFSEKCFFNVNTPQDRMVGQDNPPHVGP
jgi:molybdopterin-guanine dinucleotide biosynthesis protein A